MTMHEFTTITVAPGRVAHALSALADASMLGILGAWTTEYGGANDIRLLRRIDAGNDLQAIEKAPWFNELAADIRDLDISFYRSLPFAAEPIAGKFGNLHELRSYEFRAGTYDELVSTWQPFFERRIKLSPALMVMRAVSGNPNRLIHLWAYPSPEQRDAVRDRARQENIWPAPGGAQRWISQQSILLRPTQFSLMS